HWIVPACRPRYVSRAAETSRPPAVSSPRHRRRAGERLSPPAEGRYPLFRSFRGFLARQFERCPGTTAQEQYGPGTRSLSETITSLLRVTGLQKRHAVADGPSVTLTPHEPGVVRVLIADDQRLFAESLRATLAV